MPFHNHILEHLAEGIGEWRAVLVNLDGQLGMSLTERLLCCPGCVA